MAGPPSPENPGLPGPRDRRDDAGRIDLVYAVVLEVGEIDVAGAVDGDVSNPGQLSLHGGAPSPENPRSPPVPATTVIWPDSGFTFVIIRWVPLPPPTYRSPSWSIASAVGHFRSIDPAAPGGGGATPVEGPMMVEMRPDDASTLRTRSPSSSTT